MEALGKMRGFLLKFSPTLYCVFRKSRRKRLTVRGIIQVAKGGIHKNQNIYRKYMAIVYVHLESMKIMTGVPQSYGTDLAHEFIKHLYQLWNLVKR